MNFIDHLRTVVTGIADPAASNRMLTAMVNGGHAPVLAVAAKAPDHITVDVSHAHVDADCVCGEVAYLDVTTHDDDGATGARDLAAFLAGHDDCGAA